MINGIEVMKINRPFKKPVIVFVLVSLLFSAGVIGQDKVDAVRMSELKRLRDELSLNEGFAGSDLTITISENTLIEGLKRLEGLEVVLTNGNILRLTSVDGELKPGAGIIKIGLQAESKVKVNLVLTGRIATGENRGGAFRLPLKITDVSLKNGPFSTVFLRTFFGDWLSPRKWNEFISEVELPSEIDQALQIPGGRFDVQGSMPMVINTPRYRAPLRFAIKSIISLEGRAVAALQVIDGNESRDAGNGSIKVSDPTSNDLNSDSLESEITRLTAGLACQNGLCLRVNRRVIGRFLEQIAAAQSEDLNISLKPGRVRAEQVNAVVKFTNYTDVEGGDGHADIQALNVDRIDAGRVNVRLTAAGEVDARLRGREYGIPYKLSPKTTFSIRESDLPFQFISEGERIILRALPGTTLPFNLRFNFKVAGRTVGFNRNLVVQADQWFRRIELPSFIGREMDLPRRIEIDAGGNYFVTKKQKLNYTLSRLILAANNDSIDIMTNLVFDLK